MKKLNKIMLFLAAAVFTLTACEKNVERDPSPASNPAAVAFSQSSASVEINPNKAALEYEIKIGRTNTAEALTVNIISEGDVDVIKVPASVNFAAGEKEVPFKLTFPNAEVDSTYSIKATIGEENLDDYIAGATSFEFTVTIAAWEPAATQAIVFDGLVNVFYSTGNPGWYVSYMRKDNPDGSFDIRLINPYTVLPDYRDGNVDDPIQDQFGLYKGFPSNYPEDVDSKGSYNMDIHVLANDSATFDTFAMGMTWTYGDFYGAHAASRGMGFFDKDANTITFFGGTVACGMSAYNDGAFYLGDQDLVIYLDAQAYQNDHISIADFNDPSIQWEEVESVINQFESTIFKFTNEEQKLYKAVDQYAGNPKSPFINLYCLKDAYAEGGNLAFYWDGEDGALDIPVPQDTKLSFMKQELVIAEAAGIVSTVDVKGTAAKVFTFDLLVVSETGNEVGEFIETFTLADEAVIFEKADFIGNFVLAGYSPFDGSEDARAIEIQEVEGELVILGLDYCESIKTSFDEASGVLSIAPQALAGVFTYNDADYPLALYTMDATGSPSTSAAIELAFKLDGVAHITPASEGVGYLVRAENLGWLDGVVEFDLTPAAASEAPLRAPAAKGTRDLKKYTTKTDKATVDHLSFKGKYRPSMKKNPVQL